MKDLYAISRPPAQQTMPADSRRVFKGEIFEVYQWEQPLFNGGTATFERLARKDTAGIIAVTDDQKIIVTSQEQPSMEPFISLLGGVVDPGEKPFETAQRELKEEAGGTAKEWGFWFASQPITKIEWSVYVFIARGCSITDRQHLDGGEKITLRLVDFEEFLEIAISPDFRDFEVALRVSQMLAAGKKEELKKLLLT